jgi:hypothetical protein
VRTQQRDGSTVTIGATLGDAPSGSGVLQPGGIPFTFTRTATGTYVLRFDTRIVPVAAFANPATGGYVAIINLMSAGFVQAFMFNNAWAPVNGNVSILIDALDKRT